MDECFYAKNLLQFVKLYGMILIVLVTAADDRKKKKNAYLLQNKT